MFWLFVFCVANTALDLRAQPGQTRAMPTILALLVHAVSLVSALRLPPAPQLSRRSVLAAPVLAACPQHVWALFEAGPQGEFREMVDALGRIDELTGQLQKGELKSADDALVVLQTATIYFKRIPATMDKATDAMPLLDAAEQGKARDLTAGYRAGLEALYEGCRQKSAAAQQAAAEKVGGSLRDYLGVAAARYKVPGKSSALAYSSDPEKFAAQYYGFLSCEGQGMVRQKGSNSCVNRPKEGKADDGNGLLDFDFLTGKKVGGR